MASIRDQFREFLEHGELSQDDRAKFKEEFLKLAGGPEALAAKVWADYEGCKSATNKLNIMKFVSSLMAINPNDDKFRDTEEMSAEEIDREAEEILAKAIKARPRHRRPRAKRGGEAQGPAKSPRSTPQGSPGDLPADADAAETS